MDGAAGCSVCRVKVIIFFENNGFFATESADFLLLFTAVLNSFEKPANRYFFVFAISKYFSYIDGKLYFLYESIKNII